ncbi:hypothetical protein BGW80DRAFT_1254627 [Lactifluus volemus]|nr:hypothetical protein BGW80DRAFT_1254627 [Lactifluus volemus]
MLIDAVRLSGWVPGLNALEFSDDYEVDLPSTDCDDGEEHFETALISVATLFTAQAASFKAYGVFCAEHPGAIEIVKNLQHLFNRYPLLLAPLILNRGPTAPTGTDAVITDAKKVMVDVAALVDSANFSHLQQQQMSRIGACLSAPATVLTFICTLSPCTLAGSLDMVRVPALKAKYLATFLYEGGFLALAKVICGLWYELWYQFSLKGFELYDAADDDL